MAAGTERGDVIVFDSVLLDMHHSPVVWKEHTDNCHMLKWTKDGTRLLTASFDGTAKVWAWNSGTFSVNHDHLSSATLHYRDRDHHGRISGELKCWAVTWSA